MKLQLLICTYVPGQWLKTYRSHWISSVFPKGAIGNVSLLCYNCFWSIIWFFFFWLKKILIYLKLVIHCTNFSQFLRNRLKFAQWLMSSTASCPTSLDRKIRTAGWKIATTIQVFWTSGGARCKKNKTATAGVLPIHCIECMSSLILFF